MRLATLLLITVILPIIAAVALASFLGNSSEVRKVYVYGVVTAVIVALGAVLAEYKPEISIALTSLLYAVGILGLWLELSDIPSCAFRVWAPFIYIDIAPCTATHHASVSLSIPQAITAFAIYRTYKLIRRGVEAGKEVEELRTPDELSDNASSDVEHLTRT